tara:strand:+ start:592 stop:1038 length:447 start_codon:yes stop_codon:yes gene_type:complete
MLAELAIATAAFKTVKEFISEGKDLAEMGNSLFNYFDAKNKLQKELNKSNKSDKSDLEEFMALEQIKQQEDELRQLMIYTGRPGMWQDWIKFQAEAARRREEQRKEALRQKAKFEAQMYQWFEIGVAIILIVGMGLFLIWLFSKILTA